MTMHGIYTKDLQSLADRGRLRALRGRAGIDLASNDYLGLAESAELRQAAADALARGVPVGSGGSRLLRGNHPEHEALEPKRRRSSALKAALYFGRGFVANFAICLDAAAARRSRRARCADPRQRPRGVRLAALNRVGARHNDADAFDAAIVKCAQVRRQRAAPGSSVESLYSMDGDNRALAELLPLSRTRHEAMVVIDEAHATGVLGPQGRGLAAPFEGRDNVITLHTCGKALGDSGALHACAEDAPRLPDQSLPAVHLCHRAFAAHRAR